MTRPVFICKTRRWLCALAILSIVVPAHAESEKAAVALWDSKSDDLIIGRQGTKGLTRFAVKPVFERSFPLEYCDLSLSKIDGTPVITYACPAFYRGEAVQFAFAALPAPNRDKLALIAARYSKKGILNDDALEAFLHDFNSIGFNSFQVLLNDAKNWTVDVATEAGGVTGKGELVNLISNMGYRGYDCLLVYQSLPEFIVGCSRYQAPTKTLSTTDRWCFSFNRVSDTHVVLTEVKSKVLNVTAQGAKVNSLVEHMFDVPEAE